MSRMDHRFCPYAHTGAPDRVWVRGDETRVEVVAKRNGVIDVKLRCDNCGRLTGTLPRDVVWEWLNPFGPMILRASDLSEPCVVAGCESRSIEWHHFAPRNTFPDADDWPVLPLCRPHHVQWHRQMDGYRWHATTGREAV